MTIDPFLLGDMPSRPWGFSRAAPEPVPEVPEGPPPNKYFAGLDLGQAADHSALVGLERRTVPNPAKPGSTQYAFHVVGLKRWPLRTPYPEIVADVKALYAEPPLKGSTLAIDETGVGRPVVDMFRASSIAATLRPYSITCGSAVTSHTVAKKHLVACVQAPLSSGRLAFSEGLELVPTLVAELGNFKVTVNEQTRNESFSAWRERDTDDCVLALALALFVASVPGYHLSISAVE